MSSGIEISRNLAEVERNRRLSEEYEAAANDSLLYGYGFLIVNQSGTFYRISPKDVLKEAQRIIDEKHSKAELSKEGGSGG